MADIQQIELLGRKHAIVLPDYTEREEIVVAYGGTYQRGGVSLLRAYAAAIGLCTRLGRESGADYATCKCDPLVYGGKVYAFLRERGATPAQIASAGTTIVLKVNDATFPTQAEVDAELGKSGETEAS